jgi:hypothetical protein
MTPEIVCVTWCDAWSEAEQFESSDAHSDYIVRTVGYLVRQGPRFVSVAQEILPHGDGFRAVTHIPVSVVEQITPLRDVPDDDYPDGPKVRVRTPGDGSPVLVRTPSNGERPGVPTMLPGTAALDPA